MPPRESKANQRFSFVLAAPLWEGLFCWANNEAMNTHLYSSTRGISLEKEWALTRVWGRFFFFFFLIWVWTAGWVGWKTDGWRDRRIEGGMPRCWPEDECFSYFHTLLLVARSSTPPPQNRLFRVERELSGAQYRQCCLNFMHVTNILRPRRRWASACLLIAIKACLGVDTCLCPFNTLIHHLKINFVVIYNF